MKEPKYLEIIENGKRKTIKNGWLILRDEMDISRDTLLFYYQNHVPNLAAWRVVQKSRKKRDPRKYALALLRKLVGGKVSQAEKVREIEEKGANPRDEYVDPFKT